MTLSRLYEGTDNLEAMEAAVNYNGFLDEVINKYAPAKGTFLDFGAGTGTHTRGIVAEGRCMVCVEPDSRLLAELAAKGYETHAQSETVAEASCDFAFSLNVFEHIEDDTSAAREFIRILKPGATAVVYVPAMNVLFSSMDRKVGHFRRYNIGMLHTLMSGVGFTIESVRYADSLGFFATLAYKVFGNQNGSINVRGLVMYDRFVFPFSRFLDRFTHWAFGKNVYAVVKKKPL